MLRILKTSAMAAAALSGIAHASPLIGNPSAGAVNITVDIPPFAAALKAQGEGAVGLWTVTDSNSGLMLRLPEKIEGANAASISIYHSSGVQFFVSAPAEQFAIASTTSDRLNGMIRESFSLQMRRPNNPQLTDGQRRPAAVATLLVTAI
ncbi:MAG: hypothetical protein JWO15_1563 [Sphingomonadales bacterium]|nr:hypothetical protein [Sphingomonadales bacterium]